MEMAETKEKALHWADQLAEKVIERSKKEKRTASIKCQQTPSGGKHIGNLNDVLRAYFVYKAVLDKKEKAEFVHTSDDRDPMKEIPKRVADLEGKWIELEKLGDFKQYLGFPYSRIPDPFKCCESWSKHFTKVWMKGLDALEVKVDLYYLEDLYTQGKMDPYIKMMFEQIETSRYVIGKYQETKRDKDYIPYNAICESCGRITAQVVDFNLDDETITYSCAGKKLKKRTAEGCGHEGTINWRNGKLTWRFEWPALWALFNTTFEPFGKDHAEGSWPSGQEIARRVYNIEPPIPFVYEFFLVDGEKMSASRGNVYITQDILSFTEPEPFLFFYAKRAGKQRDLDLKNIYHLVDEFDKAEAIYFGKEKERTKHLEENMKRMYELSNPNIPKKTPQRIPYTYCSFVSQVASSKQRMEEIIKKYLEKASKQDIEKGIKRIELAGIWIKERAPDEYKITLLENMPSMKITEEIKEIFSQAAEMIEGGTSGKDLQQVIYNTAKKKNIPLKDVFGTAYQLLLGRDTGPRLGPFLISLEKEFVINRLRLKK